MPSRPRVFFADSNSTRINHGEYANQQIYGELQSSSLAKGQPGDETIWSNGGCHAAYDCQFSDFEIAELLVYKRAIGE